MVGEFKRNLSLLEIVMLGLGGTIGAGIFVLLGHAAGIAGPAVTISFSIGYLIALLTGLNYSELSSSLPIAGGGYSFAREAIKGIGSFITGWFMWFGNMAYCALSALGFAFVVQKLIPIPSALIALAALAGFSVVNMFGSKETGKIQLILITILIGILTFFIFLGYRNIEPQNFKPLAPKGLNSVFKAVGYTYVCFIGFEIISTVSGEVRNPGKNLPRAILLTLTISAIFYVLIALVGTGVVHFERLDKMESPVIGIANTFLGRKGTILMVLATVVATLSTLNASLVASGRIAYALSRDGYLPKSLKKIHSKFNTPWIAILASSMIIALFVGSGLLDLVAYLSDFGYLIGLTLINLSVIFLRRKRKKLKRPFKVPLYPLMPILGAASSLILLPVLSSWALIIGGVWVILGLLAYHLLMIGGRRIKIALGGTSLFVGILFFLTSVLSHLNLIDLPEFIFPPEVLLALTGAIFTASGILNSTK